MTQPNFSNVDVPAISAPAPAAGGGGGDDFGEGFQLSRRSGGRAENSGLTDLTIGDFFSGGGGIDNLQITGGGHRFLTSPVAGGDRRRKISDHFAPIPVNRTYFSFHNFGDAVNDVNGNQIDVKRFTFGFEKTFRQGRASYEIRLPFTYGLNGDQVLDFSADGQSGAELGNVAIATKFLVWQSQRLSLSVGSGSVWPTGSDGNIDFGGGGNLLVKNESIDILPFASFHFRPKQNCWVTFTTQLDFNLLGNEFVSNPGTAQAESGIFNDQNLLGFDVSMGKWFWRDQCERPCIKGLAGVFELHYTTTLNDADEVAVGDSFIFNPFNRQDTLNSTVGLRAQLSSRTFATLAGVFPFRGDDDRPFENEVNFNISRLY